MKKIKDFLKNNQDGSTIVWAMGVIMVLLIILGGALSISKAYTTKSMRNTAEQQAYLTAKSAIDLLISELQHPLSADRTAMNPNCVKMMNALSANPGVEIPVASVVINEAGAEVVGSSLNFDYGVDPLMGECEVSIKFVRIPDYIIAPTAVHSAVPSPSPETDPMKFSGTITITAKVKYPAGEKVLVAELQGFKESEVSGINAMASPFKERLQSVQDHKDANANGDTAEVFTRWIVKQYKES